MATRGECSLISPAHRRAGTSIPYEPVTSHCRQQGSAQQHNLSGNVSVSAFSGTSPSHTASIQAPGIYVAHTGHAQPYYPSNTRIKITIWNWHSNFSIFFFCFYISLSYQF